MGTYDRDYMRGAPPRKFQPGPVTRPAKNATDLPLWNRIKFKLWLFFHQRKNR
jgi:hypothetical protein